MKLYTAMRKNGSGGSSPSSLPNWDPTKNIYITFKKMARFDNAGTTYRAPFIEYCEDLPTGITDQELKDACMNLGTASTAKVGITRLTNTPLTTPQTPYIWGYNSDFDDSTNQWTTGNNMLNYWCIYYLYFINNGWSNTLKADAKKLRIYWLRKAIEEADPYTVGTSKQYISNRQFNKWTGTTIKGSGRNILDEFKIGNTATLYNVQEANTAYSGFEEYRCFDFYGIQNGNTPPFSTGLTSWHRMFRETNGITRAENFKIPEAAIIAEVSDQYVADLTNQNATIYFSAFWLVNYGKVLTERSLLS